MKIKSVELIYEENNGIEGAYFCDNLDDKCALLWGDAGIDYYMRPIEGMTPEEKEEKARNIEKVKDDCREKGTPIVFIKGIVN